MNNNFQKLYDLLLTDEPEKSDILVWLQGDRFDRGPKVIELYRKKFAKRILIIGNNTLVGPGVRPGENDISVADLKKFLLKKGINQSRIIVDDKALNTREQIYNLIKLSRIKKWKKIILVTSAYHLPRTYLTVVKIVKSLNYNGNIFFQTTFIRNNRKPSGRDGDYKSMLIQEKKKIKAYQLKKDIASYKSGFNYLYENMQENQLKFKKASIKDSELLLNWRNDLMTRKYSFNQEKIKPDEHLKWLKASLKNRNRKIFIVEYGSVPVGTVRTDKTGEGVEISWTVAPEWRGRGIGKKMIRDVVKHIKKPVLAKIKQINKASRRIAENAGMKIINKKEGIMNYVLK